MQSRDKVEARQEHKYSVTCSLFLPESKRRIVEWSSDDGFIDLEALRCAEHAVTLASAPSEASGHLNVDFSRHIPFLYFRICHSPLALVAVCHEKRSQGWLLVSLWAAVKIETPVKRACRPLLQRSLRVFVLRSGCLMPK